MPLYPFAVLAETFDDAWRTVVSVHRTRNGARRNAMRFALMHIGSTYAVVATPACLAGKRPLAARGSMVRA